MYRNFCNKKKEIIGRGYPHNKYSTSTEYNTVMEMYCQAHISLGCFSMEIAFPYTKYTKFIDKLIFFVNGNRVYTWQMESMGNRHAHGIKLLAPYLYEHSTVYRTYLTAIASLRVSLPEHLLNWCCH